MARSVRRVSAQRVIVDDSPAVWGSGEMVKDLEEELMEVDQPVEESGEAERESNLPQPRSSLVFQKSYFKRSKKWPARLLSMLCCLIILSVVAFVLAFIYIILRDMRSERERSEDGTEIGMLGFWSLLVLSLMSGLSCCSFSWTLTYFDSFEPGMFPPTPLSPARFRPGVGGKAPTSTAGIDGVGVILKIGSLEVNRSFVPHGLQYGNFKWHHGSFDSNLVSYMKLR
ncbi:ADP-ribosylation factor-like protein 6-interacting protein 6 isoform X1 [Latimeria chalumnae]|uniref:ADP-ribosylation factor-like protein 6-interacting protein 6 isoform X1 n=2 Tax=Latimeria chalumnae TaxID=7897 RepID=UPI0003C106DE|nr:PREDICTED: ADP-ribosylation factor-like protein 6-interacting protein 6 isoform X2 [Latimeria chalumnae]|eukprot:XP_006002131.1 PREDICTED: ADP-ribosylation factor-like protein 6-interacting protein 6 isoform X2 [Latimeria chalumnae]